MKLLEIYESIHGELPHIGKPCTIIRYAGCNLKCPYCDAPDGEGRDYEFDDVLNHVKMFENQHILITGGEPLIGQGVKALMGALSEMGYTVTVETNGTIPLNQSITAPCSSIVMDVKLFKDDWTIEETNIGWLGEGDAIKFVYDGEAQFEKARMFLMIHAHHINCMVIFSPIDVKMPLLPNFLELAKTFDHLDIRLQCQIHKVLEVG